MESERFDTWIRGLSRRAAVGGLAGSGLAMLMEWLNLDLAVADKRRKKKKGKKKNKIQAPPPDQSSPPPPPPTCTDGVKNGDETDVDCGGSCPRCANGSACTSNSDCLGALCIANTCQACTTDDQCDDVAKEACTCRPTVHGQQACKPSPPPVQVGNCAACPPDTNCFPGFDFNECFRPCGAV